jgi:osmotically-inducible protein OsmY
MTRGKNRSFGAIAAALWMSSIGVLGVAPVLNAQTKVSDDTIKDRIEYKLETYPATKKYDLRVKVENANVTLSGTVATPDQKAEAGKLAKVDGVGTVDNQIAVDKDADKTLAERAKSGMRRTGEAVTDAWITTKVKWFYLGDDLLKASSISVDTKDRVVTLNGTVKTEAGRTRALDLARDTDGVTRVVDNLKIAAPAARLLPAHP